MGKEVEEMKHEFENTLINRNAKLECPLRLALVCFLSSQVRRRGSFVMVESLPDTTSDMQVLVPGL